MKRDVALVLSSAVLTIVLAGSTIAGGVWWYLRPRPKPVPDIALESSYAVAPGRILTIEAQTRGSMVLFDFAGPDKPDLLRHDPKAVHFVVPTPGDYHVSAFTSIKGVPVPPVHSVIHVGQSPEPVPPAPPAPPSPLPDAGLRVLIVYDPSQALPAAQQAVLTATAVRQYLNDHCAKTGSQPEYRVEPVNADLSNESDAWKTMMARPRKSLPWLIVSTGHSGYEGPLPATVEETLALLKTFEK